MQCKHPLLFPVRLFLLMYKLSENDLHSANILIQPSFDWQSDSQEAKQVAIKAVDIWPLKLYCQR